MFINLLINCFELIVSFLGASPLEFFVQAGQKCNDCPGSQFTSIAAAWANIAYVTHSDFLHYVTTTKFGLWAPLLYAAAAVASIVGVAIGMPPRTYMWFMLGPAIYGFLIGTTQEVGGVDWTVAGRNQDMTQVWRDAEIGMANSDLVAKRNLAEVTRETGPSSKYPVATGLIFFDELFSTTSNLLIDWTGLYRQKGKGSSDSNLAREQGQPEGPWYLLSNSKWGMVENIVGASVRSPHLRDSLITFLTSECGDAFKSAVADGVYAAAAQSRGASIPMTIFKTDSSGSTSDLEFDGTNFVKRRYRETFTAMNTTTIPTPRSLANLMRDNRGTGSFGDFHSQYTARGDSGRSFMLDANRDTYIVCTEYLYTLVQGFRWEAGHAFHQLIRSAPRGLDKAQMLTTLFNGWDIRRTKNGPYASNGAENSELEAFVKLTIFSYLWRNELMFAPQITKMDLRYAPSEQARSFTDAYVRTSGSKSKAGELYQWAVMMPYLQGILLYVVIVAYPIICLVMVLPGYWKMFFTWVSFFAWLKLWDVGFAMVMVLERSVWAMMGNNSNMARVANMLISTARSAGSIGVSCPNGAGGGSGGGGLLGTGGSDQAINGPGLPGLCAVPRVCSVSGMDSGCGGGAAAGGTGGHNQTPDEAFLLLDKALAVGAGIDLDLANGYYVYIMSALYFAIPAITGQMVLGARAGAASLVNSMIGGSAQQAGNAAMLGFQQEATNTVMTNAAGVSQASYMKAMRAGNFGANVLNAGNAAQEAGLEGQLIEGRQKHLSGLATSAEKLAADRRIHAGTLGSLLGYGGQAYADGRSREGTGQGTGSGVLGPLEKPIMATNSVLQLRADAASNRAAVRATAGSVDAHWQAAEQQMLQQGNQIYGGRLAKQAEFNAAATAWEDRNAFASHLMKSPMIAGIGINTGAANPGSKPQELEGAAAEGYLGSAAREAWAVSGSFIGQNGRGRSAIARESALYGGASVSSAFNVGSSSGFSMPSVAGEVEGQVEKIGGAWSNPYAAARDMWFSNQQEVIDGRNHGLQESEE